MRHRSSVRLGSTRSLRSIAGSIRGSVPLSGLSLGKCVEYSSENFPHRPQVSHSVKAQAQAQASAALVLPLCWCISCDTPSSLPPSPTYAYIADLSVHMGFYRYSLSTGIRSYLIRLSGRAELSQTCRYSCSARSVSLCSILVVAVVLLAL